MNAVVTCLLIFFLDITNTTTVILHASFNAVMPRLSYSDAVQETKH